MSLSAEIATSRGGFRLEMSLDVAPGEVVALLGPNGAGKTTALRVLAGLLQLDSGSIKLADVEIAGAGFSVPPERRRVGVVFQDYLLFPHMSARENVAFGPRCAGQPRAAARATATEWLTRMGLADVADVRPAGLSGGQAQRVALARALATSPRLLLLDEPLAALDARTRLTVRSDVRRHLADFDGATVLVTHDPLDAMVLADRIVVIEDGHVVQVGTPGEIARRPRTEYVARLAGLNLYRGTASADGVELTGGGHLSVDERVLGDVFVAFPPSAVAVHRGRPEGSPRNVWSVVVAGVEQYGDRVRVEFVGSPAVGSPAVAAEVTTAAAAELDLAPGQEVWVAVKATETHAYPA